MKKYETLDGKLIELNDYNQYSLGGGWALSKSMLDRMVHHGIIRERNMTVGEFRKVYWETFDPEGRMGAGRIAAGLIQRIIDKGLVDQILSDD